MATPWWKTCVVYQIYPRSFLDSTGDNGVGNLDGIRAKLSYLANDLGVTCIWMSPVFPSPNVDYSYDISDYKDIDPDFGSMETFRALVDESHALGMKVLLDGVFNHTSDQHAWFKHARTSQENSYRNYYLWHPGKKDGSVPNGWYNAFGTPAWTWDDASGEYYFHSFASGQPDLNWRNPKVQEEVLSVMKFWLELGVDGFRLDVFNVYFKSLGWEENPPRYDFLGLLGRFVFPALGYTFGFLGYHHIYSRDQKEEMFPVLAKMRALVDQHGGTLVGETEDFPEDTYDNAAQYCGNEKLHMAFNFRMLTSEWSAPAFSRAIRKWSQTCNWPTWVVDNHDQPRSASRWGSWTEAGTEARARLVALLILTLRGTPYIYQGQEICMTELQMKRADIKDPPGKKILANILR